MSVMSVMSVPGGLQGDAGHRWCCLKSPVQSFTVLQSQVTSRVLQYSSYK